MKHYIYKPSKNICTFNRQIEQHDDFLYIGDFESKDDLREELINLLMAFCTVNDELTEKLGLPPKQKQITKYEDFVRRNGGERELAVLIIEQSEIGSDLQFIYHQKTL